MFFFLFSALAFMVLGSALLTAVMIANRRSRMAMEHRLSLIMHDKKTPLPACSPASMLKTESTSFPMRMQRLFTIGISRTWGMQISTFRLGLMAAFAAGCAWLLASYFFALSPLISAATSVTAGFFLPRAALMREQTIIERKFIDAFPEAIDTITRMVRAGLPITAAVRAVAIDAPAPVSNVFAAIGDELRIGVPIETILETKSLEIGLPDFRFFTVAIALQYATGGNLTATLETLSDIIRKRRTARLKAKAATGEIRVTAYTLGAMPFFIIGVLLVIQPGYVLPLWTDPRGHVIISLTGGFLLLAFFVMRTMMRGITRV